MSITLTINGKAISSQEGKTVLEAAREHGIEIPTLCYHKNLSPAASCRLCVVEVEGMRGDQPACNLPAQDGMVVHTETEALINSRSMILEMLLQNYQDAGYTTGKQEDEADFARWCQHYGVGQWEKNRISRHRVDSDPNPFIWVDMNKCILCTRCVRACDEIQGRFVWGVEGRGTEARIVAGADFPMLDARCESCGACVAACPTGALDNRMMMGLGPAEQKVKTTCSYCGVGCQFDLNVRDNRVIGVSSNPQAPVNGIHLCVKGRYGYDFVHHPDRLTSPMVRRYLLEGQPKVVSTSNPQWEWVVTDWETALNLVAQKFVQVRRESGPDAFGVLSSAKCTNEENYVMQKFARQVIGTHNIDHCARLCHASTVAGLAACFGSGAMSNTMKDVSEQAAAIFIIGSNPTEQHPVFGSMIRQAVHKRGVKLVVADPRRIDITEFATSRYGGLHLRQKPGTDVALLNGLMHIILRNGWEDQAFIKTRTENFDAFKDTIQKYPPELVSGITGVPVEQLEQAAEILALNKPLAVIWAMGITQHTKGVLNVLSLGNLQMLLGNMGIPGGGVNPLRGQNNVQGACDMGALVNVFPGYQSVTDAAIREKFATAWRLSDGSPDFQASPGLTVTEMMEAAGSGEVRCLYILGENPLMSDPDTSHVHNCLQNCEFLVLQEIFPSETAQYADVLLPGVSFAEKYGTFTNTERRVQLVQQAIEPFGNIRQDWEITSEIARRVLALEGRDSAGTQSDWIYNSPTEIMNEITALTPIYAGVSHTRLEHGEQLHWPVKGLDHPGTPILHIGQFSKGPGKFHACDHLDSKELPDADYPLYLTTGRVLYHWHGAEMTRRAKGLMEVYPETLIEVSPEDAIKLGLNGDDQVRVRSRRGEMSARALITDRVPSGLIFGNFHFPGEQNVNNLTIAAVDPTAKIPEYKACAVKVERIEI
jgi:formate dehydrogenase alpha subunit